MKANMQVRLRKEPVCFSCIMDKFLAQLAECGPQTQDEFRRRFTAMADRLDEDTTAPALYFEGRKLLNQYIPDTERQIYEPIKQAYNQALLDMEQKLQNRLDSAADPLELALKLARAGNYLDVACVDNITTDKLQELLDRTSGEALDSRVYGLLRADLENASSLVYFTDNAGEAVLDKLCVRTLKRLYPALTVTVVVRGGFVQSDITLEDAEQIGLMQEARVIGSGTALPGTQLRYVSDEVLKAAEAADVILSKGQGNFEGLVGCGLNVYYLFLCKCHLFTERFSLPQFSGCFLREQELAEQEQARWEQR